MTGADDAAPGRPPGRRQNVALAGVAVVACAACCAGPVLGVLAAIGLGTAVGAALWGVGAVVVGALVAVVVVRRRAAAARRGCDTSADGSGSEPVAVASPSVRPRP